MAEFESEILVDWAGGDCLFRMSVPINDGPPSPRPRITGDLILIVDSFSADGRRQPPHIRVILPIPLLDTAQLAVVTSARIDVVHAVVEAWSRNQFHGGLPEALVLVLADKLSRFFRNVAGEMGAALPDITYVSAVGRVRLFNADGGEDAAEEEGDGEEEVAMEEGDQGEVEVVAMEEEMGGEGEGGEEEEGDQGVGGEEMGGEEGVEEEEDGAEGEEETRCAICLGRMASAEGRWERWWLPCCHCFHRGCLQRWLQQKAECPLCRAPAGASAGGRVHMVRMSSDPNFFATEEDQSGGSTALLTQKKDEFIVSSCIFGDPCIISNLVCFLLL